MPPALSSSGSRVVHSNIADEFLCWLMMITWSPWFTFGFRVGVVPSVCLDKVMRAQTSCDSTAWNIFMPLKSFLLCLFSLCFLVIPDSHCSFHCLCTSSFPECHLVGITQNVAFLYQYISYTNMHSSLLSLYGFSCVRMSYYSAIRQKVWLLSIVFPLPHCQKSVSYIYVHLFLHSLFCSMNLLVASSSSTTLSSLL